jgi:hypothetical protein
MLRKARALNFHFETLHTRFFLYYVSARLNVFVKRVLIYLLYYFVVWTAHGIDPVRSPLPPPSPSANGANGTLRVQPPGAPLPSAASPMLDRNNNNNSTTG